jgi:pimeloyl-ACP methyl ester carboxylesterase
MLLLTGSGPQNRDEEIFGHRPFAVIADYLTRRGYLVLRVDDRGVGKTTGFSKEATTKDFADDAMVSFEYLKSLPGVNKKKLGLLGHSEGGMIAQLVAAQRSDVAFVIKLAAPGQPVMDLMAGQNRAVLLASGMQAEAVNKYIELYRPLSAAIVNAPSDTAAMLEARRLIDNWMQTTTPANILATTGIRDEATKQAFIDQFIRQLRQPWFRYFMQYDPDPFIRKTGAKVLALNGDRDIQVVSSDNLPALKASLQRSRSPKFDIVELKGLNHLFQRCSRCTVDEYMQLEETFAPEALETISAWLDKNVR